MSKNKAKLVAEIAIKIRKLYKDLGIPSDFTVEKRTFAQEMSFKPTGHS